MSIFILIGVYALSVIDAYVDASLSEFDISDDLSLRIQPAVINVLDTSPLTYHTKMDSGFDLDGVPFSVVLPD